MPKWFLLGFIKRVENFKKKSLCDLKLKTEKFENIHAQKKKKKGKDKEKKKRKRKTDTRRCKGTKKKKENIRKKKRKKILRHVILKSITGNKH